MPRRQCWQHSIKYSSQVHSASFKPDAPSVASPQAKLSATTSSTSAQVCRQETIENLDHLFQSYPRSRILSPFGPKKIWTMLFSIWSPNFGLSCPPGSFEMLENFEPSSSLRQGRLLGEASRPACQLVESFVRPRAARNR